MKKIREGGERGKGERDEGRRRTWKYMIL